MTGKKKTQNSIPGGLFVIFSVSVYYEIIDTLVNILNMFTYALIRQTPIKKYKNSKIKKYVKLKYYPKKLKYKSAV